MPVVTSSDAATLCFDPIMLADAVMAIGNAPPSPMAAIRRKTDRLTTSAANIVTSVLPPNSTTLARPMSRLPNRCASGPLIMKPIAAPIFVATNTGVKRAGARPQSFASFGTTNEIDVVLKPSSTITRKHTSRAHNQPEPCFCPGSPGVTACLSFASIKSSPCNSRAPHASCAGPAARQIQPPRVRNKPVRFV